MTCHSENKPVNKFLGVSLVLPSMLLHMGGKDSGNSGDLGNSFLKPMGPKGPWARIQGIQGILRNSSSKPKDHLGPWALKLGSKCLFLPPCWFITDPIVSQITL